jgi:hypothetical protein
VDVVVIGARSIDRSIAHNNRSLSATPALAASAFNASALARYADFAAASSPFSHAF